MERIPDTFKILIQPEYPGFIDLPWHLPLVTWPSRYFVDVARGISRHVVRFTNYEGALYALKELPRQHAEKEYRLLLELADSGLQAVEVVGVVVDRGSMEDGDELDAVLITKHLDFALPYRTLFRSWDIQYMRDNLLNALAQLLVQLHLAGFFWGDCSLSNTLFRRDAGTLAAYLVDTETSEMYPLLSDRIRDWELEIATENIAGELFDLIAGFGPLPGLDPIATAEELCDRYERLWAELNREEVLQPHETYRIEERIQCINDLGFDIQELELVKGPTGDRVRMLTHLVEPGHHRRRLLMLTGLSVQENQAHRLLNNLFGYRAQLEQQEGREIPEPVVAYRWLQEVYQPTVNAIEPELRDKLDPAEIFHQILDHRWYRSEEAGYEISLEDAVRSYVDTVLRHVPDERIVLPAPADLELEEEEIDASLEDGRRPAPEGTT